MHGCEAVWLSLRVIDTRTRFARLRGKRWVGFPPSVKHKQKTHGCFATVVERGDMAYQLPGIRREHGRRTFSTRFTTYRFRRKDDRVRYTCGLARQDQVWGGDQGMGRFQPIAWP